MSYCSLPVLTIHSQASPVSRQYLCHAYAMNTEQNACFSACVNKQACRHKNPARMEKCFAFMVSQRNARGAKGEYVPLNMTAPASTLCLRAKRTSPVGRLRWGLGSPLFHTAKANKSESWTRGGLRCSQRLDKSVRSSCVHKEGYKRLLRIHN